MDMAGPRERMAAPEKAGSIARGTLLAMLVAVGIAVANIYYNQPMLGLIEAEFPHQSITGMLHTDGCIEVFVRRGVEDAQFLQGGVTFGLVRADRIGQRTGDLLKHDHRLIADFA